MTVSMLWYLLFPIRGTAQPPRLTVTHPVRRAFYRHGKTTAQHWLVAMLFSVAIAMAFSYPTISLAGNPTAGLTAYPPHFWTTAKPISNQSVPADIEMRQIWVHGSYMEALNKRVLDQGLAIQQSMVDNERIRQIIPALAGKLSWTTLQWGYHSPFMYWNNSAQAIEDDEDLLQTINANKRVLSSLNVALRPTSVFAGKRFDGQYLQAADALVISLMNKVEGGVGQVWQHEMRSLSSGVCHNCTFFPPDADITRHRVYEFGFTPLSVQEHVALTLAYTCMALYVLVSLRRMRAFHSRFGLVVTAITQMTCSILASFTICNILDINLSMIPQNAYPFVVLVIGLENMFRLINAVLAYPPTMATEIRIANALGDVGPLSVATAAQNLIILSVLSTVVSSGVAAFCAFAAIATLFDVFFLLTFFVAVLNVDIRRLELQDALTARQNQPRHRRRPSPSQHLWFDALIQGRLPFSTRMAGTAVTTTFILSLNYHFFEHKGATTTLRHLLGSIKGEASNFANLDPVGLPPMNATLTAEEWMRMQDFDTAKEVLQLAKPGADTFVIRIFEPLIVVLSGADRTEALQVKQQWMQTFRRMAVHHFYPVAVAVVFVVAFVAVLMNFLLYNEAGDDDNQIDLEQTEDSLLVQTLGLPHKLDVVKIASSNNGHFVTVALDRTIAIAIADRARHAHRMVSVPPKVLQNLSWPIRNIAIDDSGEWLACHGADDNILVYHTLNGMTLSQLLKSPDDHPAVVFEFLNLQSTTGMKLYLMLLTSGGRLTMTPVDEPRSSHDDLSQIPLVGASIVNSSSTGRRLVIITEVAQIAVFCWVDGAWTQAVAATLQPTLSLDQLTGQVNIEAYSEYDSELLLITTSTVAIFLDGITMAHEANFNFQDITETGHGVDGFLISPPRKCPSCNGIAWRKVAISRSVPGEEIHELTTWSAESDEDSCICLSRSSPLCRSFETLRKEKYEIGVPDAWCSVKSQAVLGVRKQLPHPSRVQGSKSKASSSSKLKQRRRTRQITQTDIRPDQWEAYKLSVDGEMITVDVTTEPGTDLDDHETGLYVNTAGPVAPLDAQAVAVAFGNTVKIIRASRKTSISRHTNTMSTERQSSISIMREAVPQRS